MSNNSKLVGIKIDRTKIDGSRLFKGKSGEYYDFDIWIDQDADEDWKMVSVSHSQSKEEKAAKAPRIYVGNGKLIYGWDSQNAGQTPQNQSSGQQTASQPSSASDMDEIPFARHQEGW